MVYLSVGGKPGIIFSISCRIVCIVLIIIEVSLLSLKGYSFCLASSASMAALKSSEIKSSLGIFSA